MPEKATKERARKAKRQGKSPSTQAGEYVREEIHHVREGKHGARSPEQAIAIGLSKARRAGVDLPPPERGKTSAETRKQAARDVARGRRGTRKKSSKRARASLSRLKGEGKSAAGTKALSRHAKRAAAGRTAADRSRAARKASRTKGPAKRKAAARKAARTRARAS
jgi:hypothetical protein